MSNNKTVNPLNGRALPPTIGVIGGIIAIGYLFTLYSMDKQLLISGWEKVTWLVTLILMCVGAVLYRKKQTEGFLSMRPTLNAVFKIFIIAYLMKYIFVYLLYHYIDTSLIEMAKEVEMEILRSTKPPEMTDMVFAQQLEEYEKGGGFGPSLFGIGIMFEIVMGFLLSLAIANLFKLDRPEYE